MKDPQKPKPGRPEAAYDMRTRMIHGDAVSPHWDYSHQVVPPMSSSVTYRVESTERGLAGFKRFGQSRRFKHDIAIYDRLHEPTSGMLEDRLAEAEGGECAVCFTTGMAAISGALGALLQTGGHVIAHHVLYPCTASLLRNWYRARLGVEVQFIDLTDMGALRAALRPNTRVVYFESPANPTLDVIDMGAVAAVLKQENKKPARRGAERRIFSICDNTFATPVCQRPLAHGIDVVVHSLTKGIGGFGTDMGGMVVAPAALWPQLVLYRKDFGGAISSKAAWPPLVYGLPTLPLRMRQMQASAQRIAEFLEAQPLIERVRYPGLKSHPQHAIARRQMRGYDGAFMPGSMVYFTLREEPGESARAKAFANFAATQSYCMTLAVSLGQVKTLLDLPAAMTHSRLDEELKACIDPGGIRLSVGLEPVEDLLRDLGACFAHVAGLGKPGRAGKPATSR
jgi:cystathionine beta-lyase/cystathionine gamma-synthase